MRWRGISKDAGDDTERELVDSNGSQNALADRQRAARPYWIALAALVVAIASYDASASARNSKPRITRGAVLVVGKLGQCLRKR
jgi:hypothetical protein